jgi:hypothetical protein
MAEVSLGKLWIRFGIDDAELKKGRVRTEKELRDLEKRVQQFQSRATQTLGRVAPWLGISGAILGIGKAFQTMAQDAKALEDLRISSGLTVRSLYELRQMVNQTGGSVQDLTTAVNAFDAAILAAARDSRSEAAQAFRLLGVSIRDANGNLTTLDQVTDQLAAKWPTYTDGAAKAALGTTLFGGAATAMTRALNEGQQGVRRAREEVDKYGRSTDGVHRAQLDWVNKTNELNTSLTNLRDQSITPLIPSLIRLVDWFSKLAERTSRVGETFKMMRLDYLDHQLRNTGAEVERLEKKVAASEQEFMELAQRTPEATARLELIRNEIIKGNRELGEAIKNYRNVRAEVEAFEKAVERSKSGSGWDAMVKPTRNDPARTQAGLTPDQQRALKASLDQVSLLQQQLNGLPQSYQLLATVNRDTYAEMQTVISSTIDEVNRKYKDQEDVVRNLHNLKMQLAREEQNVAMQTADMVGSAVSAMFAKSKAAAMAETIIHTATAVMRALRDVPWPYNLVQAAAIAATGAANLAKIRSASEKNGGGGGAAATVQAPASAAGGSSHNITGVDRGHFYSGQMIEGVIASINEAVKNGATLITTRNVAA